MQKLELTINQTMGVITGNFEDIKKSLETEMAVYETKQFAEEDKQKAKGDLADLRKLRKAVNDRKVEVKKEYMKPYEVFEGKVKELIGVIDKPIALIDGQVKEFEAKRVEEKKAEIQNLYNELVEEELHDYIPLEKIYGEKWTNASTTMKSIREEINSMAMQTRQDIATIKAMKSEKEEQALNLYMENNNLDDPDKEIEITIIKINWVDMENMVCNVTGKYHENEEPMHERIKKFRVVRK